MVDDVSVGAVVSIVQGDHVLLKEGYGVRIAGTKDRIDPDKTLFRLGSLSQLFTAIGVLQQVERQSLQLNDTIEDHLTPKDAVEFGNEHGLESNITVHDVLTHTAGFEDKLLGLFSPTPRVDEHDSLFPLKPFPQRVRPSGRALHYSNHGYALLGHILARKSNQTFPEYMRTNILEPLGLKSTTFILYPKMDKALENNVVAVGHDVDSDPDTPSSIAVPLYCSLPAAGSISSTATDMTTFLQWQLYPEKYAHILDPEWMHAMQKRQFTPHPMQHKGVGYGWFDREFADGSRMLLIVGTLVGHASMMIVLPSKKIGLFAAFNAVDVDALYAIAHAFVERFYEPANVPLLPIAGHELPDQEERFTKIVGRYGLLRGAESTFERMLPSFAYVNVNVSTAHPGHLELDYHMPSLFSIPSLPQHRLIKEVAPYVFNLVTPTEHFVDTIVFRHEFFEDGDPTEKDPIKFMAAEFLGMPALYRKLEFYEYMEFNLKLLAGAAIVFALDLMFRLANTCCGSGKRPNYDTRLDNWTFITTILPFATVLLVASSVGMVGYELLRLPRLPFVVRAALGLPLVQQLASLAVVTQLQYSSHTFSTRWWWSLVVFAASTAWCWFTWWWALDFRYA
jgi:CubicO group peptidase (beta-lactamase class C family)